MIKMYFMKHKFKLRQYKLQFIFFLFLRAINISISQATPLETDEVAKISVITTNPSILEDENHLLEFRVEDNDQLGETTLFGIPRNLLDHYVNAFQDDFEINMSKLSVFKYTTSLVGGLIGSIPQIGVALNVGKFYGSIELGYGLVATTILCTGGITSWIIWEFISDTQELVKTAQKSKQNSGIFNVQTLKNIGKGVFSLVLGALSSSPEVYKTYKYNELKVMSLMTFIYETIPRTLGFYKLFSSISFKPKCVSQEEEENVIDRGLSIIDLSKEHFLKLCKEKGIRNISIALNNYSTSQEIYSYLTSHLTSKENQPLIEEQEEILVHSHAKKFPRKIIQCLALIFPLGSACVDMVLAYRGYEVFVNSPILLIPLSSVSVLPNLVLNSYVVTQAAGDLFDIIYSYKFHRPSSEFFGVFYPKVKVAFIVTSLLLAVSATGGGVYFILDNFKDTLLEPAKYFFSTLSVISNVTFGTYTIMSTLSNLGELVVKKYNKESSYLFGCIKKLSELRETVINSSVTLIRNFIYGIKPSQGKES